MFILKNKCGSIDHVSARLVSIECLTARLEDDYPLRS